MADFDNKEKIQKSIDSCPFNAFCGIQVESVNKEAGELTMRMPMRAEMERLPNSGQMHGGPIASLIDTAGCYACMMALGYGVPTINFRTDYYRPVSNSELKAVAKVRRVGRTIAAADVDVYDKDDRLVATGRASYSANAG
jgi:uncharacterized protein (TIGR00369 family)